MKRTITYPDGIVEVQEGTVEELSRLPLRPGPFTFTPYVPIVPQPINPWPGPTWIGVPGPDWGTTFTFTSNGIKFTSDGNVKFPKQE